MKCYVLINNLIGSYHILGIGARNLTSFTRPFLTGRCTWGGHETGDHNAEMLLLHVLYKAGQAFPAQLTCKSPILTEGYSPPEVLLLLQVPLCYPLHMWLASKPVQKYHTTRSNANENCTHEASSLIMMYCKMRTIGYGFNL